VASLGLALGLAASASAQLVVDPGIVVRTVETSLWDPPSPDPSGITYRPDNGQLITCDAEVEEIVDGITYYEGVNVWTHSRTGVVTSTYTTVGNSNEPVGISFDPAGGRLWYSDDVRGSIFQVTFGPDGIFGTADDSTFEMRNIDDAGCTDLEDLTYNNFEGTIYTTSTASEICKIATGPNGVFNGLPPQGDDILTQIPIASSPFPDPEGIVYDPIWNTLVIADRSTRDLYEITTGGGVLRKIDVNFPGGTKPAGVTIAPGSINPMLRNYYVVDRKVDNDGDPDENDGRMFEVVAIPLGGNGPPIVDAGPAQVAPFPGTVNLNGFVSDDGHPYPPSTVTAVWSKQSGPGTVTFGNANQAVTTATFSVAGIYVLQLVGNDSALSTLDTVQISHGATASLSVTTSGPGSVTLSPPGGTYLVGQTVTLTAVPNAGAAFTGWSGALTGTTNPRTLVMDSNKSVTASFVSLATLSVTTSGPGSVTLSPPGGSYLPGTVVTLTAVPGTNAVFSGWGGALSGTTNPRTLTVNANTSVSATFTQLYNLSTAAVGPGTVTRSPPTGPYPSGSTVTVTATPNADSAFIGWSGALSGTTNPAGVLMNADKSVTGTFATLYDVSVSTTGPGTVTLSPPGGTYPAGTVVTVTATPNASSVFLGFGGALTGTTTPQQLTVNSDKSVSATFAAQYTLAVTPSGPGTVTLNPPGGLYNAGTSVTVTAVPNADSAFTGWSGGLTGTTNPRVVVMNANTTATANFATLFDVTASATGPGTISLSPPGGTYPAGTVVNVTATPNASSAFLGFGGALTGTTSPQALLVDGDKTVTASFIAQHTLTVTPSGPGTVTLNPPGGVYNAGTSVTVTAVPNADSAFLGFSGGLTGTTNPQVVVVNANTTATATFATLFDVTASASGPGTISLSPPGGTYPAGTVVNVTATPNASSAFLGFSGALTGTTSPQPLLVDGDKTVTASFVAQHTLTVTPSGPGTVTLNPPGGVYNAGTSVTVTAVPNADSAFTGWSGGLTGTTNPRVVVMSANTTATATFATLFDVTASATGPGTISLSPPGGTYPNGTVVTVTATPDASSAFLGFGGALSGTTSPQLLLVDGDKTVTASFVAQHTLSVTPSGPGTVTLNPPGGLYNAGTSVTVTAVPDADSAFTGFAGGLTGTTNPQVVVVNANTTATATFATLFDVTASASGPGTISLSPPGGTYPAGTVVNVTATPNAGAGFTGFGGALSGTTSPQALLVDGDMTVTASFVTQHTLNVTPSGPGTVTLNPPGGLYNAGTSVTVTAVANADSAFTGWSGDLTGTTNPQVVVVNANTTATAAFATLFDVTASASGPGTISLSPPGGTYPAGTVVNVTATPNAGAGFAGFGGALSGTTSPQALLVDGDKTVTAGFVAQHTLTVTPTGPGIVTLNPPGGVYNAGTSVTVTAVPNADSAFTGWSGDLTGTTNPQVVVVNANTSATATFATLFDVATSVTGPGTISLDPPGGTYPAGTVVNVTATPGANAVFTGFAGALSGTTSPQALLVDGDKSVSASFAGQVTLAVTPSGPGTVTLDPPGGLYTIGTSVTVTAVPNADSAFTGFGGDLSGTTNPQVVVVNTNTSATATFATLFDVATSVTGSGAISLDPPGGTYPAGTVVNVTATPDAGAGFAGFGGALSGTTSPQALLVDADKTVSASFVAQHTLAVTASGPGSVTLDPPGGVYNAGTSVTVTAVPNADSAFTGWSGGLSGTTNPQVVVVDANTTATATFATLFDVATSVTGPGTVSLDPPGGTYPAGTVVNVTATPDAGSAFTGFGGDLSGTTSPQALVVDADKTVSASFAGQVTLTVTPSGPGTVTLDPPGGLYTSGSSVTVTAVPDADSAFTGFGGDLSGTTNPQIVVVNANTTATATFAALFDVATSVTGSGTISLDPPGGTYPAGTVVNVTATPEAGFAFTGFGGDLGGTTSPQALLVDADKTVSATFSNEVTLSVSAVGPGAVTLEPPGGLYTIGTSVTVTAVPDADAAFTGWSGGLGGTANPQVVVVNANTSATATFATLFDVTVSAAGPGTVTLDPTGGTYPAGTSVTITALPDADAAFTGWSGDLGGATNPKIVSVSGDLVASASFATLFDVALSVTGPGSVTLDPPGGTYPAGTIVNVAATPDAGAGFTGFGGDLAGTASPQPLTVDADKTVSAAFQPLASYTLTISIHGGGTVGVSPPTGPYLAGSTVTLTATPAFGNLFARWSGDATGSFNPLQLTMDANKSVQAIFGTPAPPACGIGPELVALLPPLGWLYRRRRARRAR